MTASPRKPSAVVFDWDNTLVDTWPTIHRSLAATFEAMGHCPWTFEETRARVRLSLRDSFPVLFGDRWEEAMDVFYGAFESLHIDALAPADGAGRLLSELRTAGVHLAVVSNKTGRYLRLEAEHLGWDCYFDRIVGAGDAEHDKPAPEALRFALAEAPVAPGPEVWFVGDSGVDMEIAHRTGCIPILVRDSENDSDEFGKWPPRHHFRSCDELCLIVKRWRV